jgi:hypothetical protein
MTEFSEDEMRRPIPRCALPLGSANASHGLQSALNGKEDRPTIDGSSEQPQMRAGLDIGVKYSYLCLIDTLSGVVIEEGRLRTTPEAFRLRFASEQPMRIAIERQEPSRPGSAVCSKGAPTRSWWPTHAS